MDDDYLEIHAKEIALVEVNKQVQKFINKIEDAKIPVKDDWSEGLNMGLDWAIRILTKDKSAS